MVSFLERYPEATLQDIYKGCFQGFFGAAHAVADREAVSDYILAEMEQVAVSAEPVLEPCGWRGNYYRVDLAWVRSGRVELSALVDAFMAGAGPVEPRQIEDWRREWALIESVVRSVAPDIPRLEEDADALRKMLSEGRYAVHHSAEFNAAYNPHYRVVPKSKFGLIFPLPIE